MKKLDDEYSAFIEAQLFKYLGTPYEREVCEWIASITERNIWEKQVGNVLVVIPLNDEGVRESALTGKTPTARV